MYKSKAICLMFATAALAGCAGFDSGGAGSSDAEPSLSLKREPYGTCDRSAVASINLCMEAVGSDYNEEGYLTILQTSCESSGGAYSTANCGAQDAFGLCIVSGGQPNATYISYYPPTYSADSAKSACANAGGVYFLLYK
ncbi:MAG TPA: hypothetical protein PKC28_04925 [Bdellovibrionales bacterium]|nr:hypothetical protein [Bdellovibrionales bacterium]